MKMINLSFFCADYYLYPMSFAAFIDGNESVFPVGIVEDDFYEGTEAFTVVISSTSSATIEIVDDERKQMVTNSAEVFVACEIHVYFIFVSCFNFIVQFVSFIIKIGVSY